MKLLLHVCCAPCAIYPIKIAKDDDIETTGFFYNPNIHPFSEYRKREREAQKYFRLSRIKFISPPYMQEDFFQNVPGGQNPPERCFSCWDLRLSKTASIAKEKGFDAFATTLLGSPYQDHQILKDIAQRHARRTGVEFYYRDFRTGFRTAHTEARGKGMYCQNYCGCIFSKIEREEKRQTKIRNPK